MAPTNIYKDDAGEYRFRITGDNGEIIAQSSEGYSSKQGAMRGLAALHGQVITNDDGELQDTGE